MECVGLVSAATSILEVPVSFSLASDPMKHILFYATKEDLVPLLEVVDSKGAVKYVRTGNFPKDMFESSFSSFNTGAEIPNLGKASADSSSACATFLVCERGTPINLQTIQGINMERICVDQLVNPDSVTFTPGGVWNEDVVLHGRVATVSDSQISQALMKRFQSAIKKNFSKVRAFYVGPKAAELLGNGKRLTISVHSPREFDLVPVVSKS